ncbi:MAG TPA: PTS sugar transporter subunit IIA [Pirellulaceae bacterium]|nr:PTS sugar transporter subunit IIA [Pirellulaceae bacterium]
MPHEDFDTDSLAAYLHLSPAQIARMADREKLPGRKIGGRWRFSQAEIHHWLEERIGASDASELVEVEEVLQGNANQTEQATISIADHLPLAAIAIPLPARTRSSVIVAMTQLAAKTGLLWDPEKMAEAIRARENLHPTALDNGVALLHARRPMSTILAEPFLALGITPNGIPFGGGGLTDLFFLVCSCDDRGHLRLLARLSRLIGSTAVLASLRDAQNPTEVLACIEDCEQDMPS